MSSIAAYPPLANISYANTVLTDSSLAEWVKTHPHTKTLDLSHCPDLTARGLRCLSQLPNLRALNLSGNKRLDDFSFLSECRNLENLVLADLPRLYGSDLRPLAGHPSLIYLDLSGCPQIDSGVLQSLASTQIHTLLLNRCAIRHILPELAHCPHLQRLALDATDVTAEALSLLATWPSLRSLSLENCQNIDATIQTLLPKVRIQGVFLASPPPRPDAWTTSQRMFATLNEKINSYATVVQDPAAVLLPEIFAHLDNFELKNTYSYCTPSPSQIAPVFANRMNHNQVGYGSEIELHARFNNTPFASRKVLTLELSSSTPALADLTVRCPRVRAVDLSGCDLMQDEELKALAGWTDLTSLKVDDMPQIGDAGYQNLAAACPSLTHLSIQYNSLTSDGFAALASLPRLQFLGALHTPCDDNKIAPFAYSRSLETLLLNSGTPTERSLRTLNTCQNLHNLQIPGAQIDSYAPLRNNTSLRALQIDNGCLSEEDIDFLASTKLQSLCLLETDAPLDKLAKIPSLQKLALHSNSDISYEQLQRLLQDKPSLTTLDIYQIPGTPRPLLRTSINALRQEFPAVKISYTSWYCESATHPFLSGG